MRPAIHRGHLMVWFRVDDGFPTSRKVLQIPRRRRAAAIGVWTLAGAWVSRELTDGYIPTFALDEIPGGETYVSDLVSVGLWKECDGGWMFHDWFDYQPTKADVEAAREGHAARQKAYRDRRKAERDASRVTHVTVTRDVTRDTPVTVPRPDPTRPDPTVVPTELLEEQLPKAGRAKRATRISDNFTITEDMRTWAATEVPGMDIDQVTKRFIFHFQGASGQRATMVKWDAAWKKWMLGDYAPRTNGHAPNTRIPTSDQRVMDGLAIAQRLAAEEQAADNHALEIDA